MRFSSQSLPAGCFHLRLHLDDTEDYIAHTILKPVSAKACELCGLNIELIKFSYVRLAFKECANMGYAYCYIERRKNGKIVKTRFNLQRYK